MGKGKRAVGGGGIEGWGGRGKGTGRRRAGFQYSPGAILFSSIYKLVIKMPTYGI